MAPPAHAQLQLFAEEELPESILVRNARLINQQGDQPDATVSLIIRDLKLEIRIHQVISFTGDDDPFEFGRLANGRYPYGRLLSNVVDWGNRQNVKGDVWGPGIVISYLPRVSARVDNAEASATANG